MKPTSKILLGMALVPCAVMVLGAAAMLIFSSPKEGKDHPIPASEKTTSISTKPFNQVKLKSNYGSPKASICVNKADDCSLTLPLNWEEYIKYSVEDSVLTLDLGIEAFGSGAITVNTPAISSVRCLRNGCEISGFDSDSLSVYTPDDLTFKNCRLGHVLIDTDDEDYPYLSPDVRANSSVIDSLLIHVGASINFTTPNQGRINVVDWHPVHCSNTYFYTTIKKANVGVINWTPAEENQKLEVNSYKSASIIFDK